MSKIVVVADFFVNHVLGGGELNNEELISMLKKEYEVEKIQSHMITDKFLDVNTDSFFIISNFINLSFETRERISNLKYIIYEHDHKYLKSRNPATYKNFKAPLSELVNYRFYRNAKAILCQSAFHQQIMKSNLEFDNIINLGGNLWSLESLELIRKLNKEKKEDAFSILNSRIEHKNTN